MSPHILIFGFGYTAHFLAKKLRDINFQVTVTTRNSDRVGFDSEFECDVIHFSEKSIAQALATTTHILISTPPTPDLGSEPVLINFGGLLETYIKNIQWIGYLSSTSVYGDHQGDWVNESSEPKALGHQGTLRLAAENEWISFARVHQLPLTIFRLAGIYGPQRNVLARLMNGKKDTIVKKGHFFSRIHVEDIVLVIIAAMQHSKPGIVIYNVADDEPSPNYVVDDYAASLLQLAPLHEVAYDMAVLSPMAKEFYSHNKRVSNIKLKKELKIQFIYPTYKEGLTHLLYEEGYL
ncbi:MAG: NAD(P)-dependent oxidoreductase [Legionella sp.]|nr:MAG: NAD(P)-dependent oxidoreductase [Legionella sp.]